MRRLLLLTTLLITCPPAAPAQEADPTSGVLQPALETGGHTAHIDKIFFSADGRHLVSVGHDQAIRYWDVQTGRTTRVVRTMFVTRIEGHTQTVGRGKGDRVVLAGRFALNKEGKRPYIFLDPTKDEDGRVLEVAAGSGPCFTLALSPNGKYLAVGAKEGLFVYDAATGATLHKVEKKVDGAEVSGLDIKDNGGRLAFLLGGRLHVLGLAAGGNHRVSADRIGTRHEAHSCLWDREDKHVLVCTDNGIEIWDPVGSMKRVKKLDLGKTNALAWDPRDPKGRKLFRAGLGPKGQHGRVAVVDLDTGKEEPFPLPVGTPEEATDVCLSADGRLVAAVAHDRLIYLWDRDGSRNRVVLGRPIEPFAAVGWDKDNHTVGLGDTRDKLDRAFDFAACQFVDRKEKALAEFQRAVLFEKGVGTLKVGHAPTLTRRGKPDIELEAQDKVCTAGTLLPGGRAALGGPKGGTIYIDDTSTGKRRNYLQGHRDQVVGLAPSPDRRFLASVTGHEDVKVWKVDEPNRESLLLTLFVSGKDWIVFTKEGYYDATPGGEELMGWTANNGLGMLRTFYPAEQFRKVLFRPDVIREVLARGSVAEAVKAANAALAANKKPVPRAPTNVESLLPPGVALSVVDAKNLPQIKVKVAARAVLADQPIKSLRVLLDGRWLPDGKGVVKFGEGKEKPQHEQTWDVEIPPGEHTLSALAWSKDDTPSYSNAVDVQGPPPAPAARPKLHHLAVGIDPYEHLSKLKCAENDARGLAEAFAATAAKGGLYQAVEHAPLLGTKATPSAILDQIDAIRKVAKPGDLFLFSFAGHGVRKDDEFFLCTAPANPAGSTAALATTAVSGAALRQKLMGFPCQVLLFLDACHSGAFVGDIRPATNEAMRVLADVEVRVAVMAAAKANEEAQEKGGNGLFTAAVLKALKQDPNAFWDKKTGKLNVWHLQAFVVQAVLEDSKGKQEPYLKMPQAMPAIVVAQFPEGK